MMKQSTVKHLVKNGIFENRETTFRERLELMKELAISKDYKIVESDTPAYHMVDAVKGNVKIHIASIAHKDSVLAVCSQFQKDLDSPQDFQIQE